MTDLETDINVTPPIRPDFITIRNALEAQKNLMSRLYDIESMSVTQREELTKTLVLGLHGEATSLADCVNYRDHRDKRLDVSKSRLCHEAVDVFRYMLGVLNTWEITPQEFEDAFFARDNFLITRHDLAAKKYDGQSTIIVDIDDVIAGFRDGFVDWLLARGVDVDRNSTDYYFLAAVTGSKNFNSERLYQEFIELHGLRDMLPSIRSTIDAVNRLHDEGYWIQLLTARPGDNPTCVYDTYQWLTAAGVKFDRLNFAGEKFLWLLTSEPYEMGRVVCALEDSPKHAGEYAKHGVRVLAPVKSYNAVLNSTPGVVMYTENDSVYDLIRNIFSGFKTS